MVPQRYSIAIVHLIRNSWAARRVLATPLSQDYARACVDSTFATADVGQVLWDAKLNGTGAKTIADADRARAKRLRAIELGPLGVEVGLGGWGKRSESENVDVDNTAVRKDAWVLCVSRSTS